MKKIFIPALILLLAPMIVLATADALTMDVQLSVNGYTLDVSGKVDDMVVDTPTITFSLSTNSVLTVRSYDRVEMTNNLGIDLLCSSGYSEITVDGATLGSSLVVTVGSNSCSGAVGGGIATETITGTTSTGSTESATDTSKPTTTNGQVTATVSGGGKTTLTATKSVVTADLPADALSASAVVKIEEVAKETATASRPTPSSRNIVGDSVYDYTAANSVSGEAVSTFSKNAVLTFTYTDSQIANLDESTLKIFYWKESTSQWVALPTTVDASANKLTVETSHFTYFAIMGLEESEEGEDMEEAAVGGLADGDLVRNPNAEGMAQFDIYIIKLINNKKFKRLILSPHVFESYSHFDKNSNGSPWDDVIDVSQATLDEYTISNLVRADGDTKVYELTADGDSGVKQWINMTAAEFNAQYDADSVYVINSTDRDAYSDSGSSVTNKTIKILADTLKVRSLPSLDGDVLTSVKIGEIYDLIEEQDGWYKITANGETGWCYGGDTGGYAVKQ